MKRLTIIATISTVLTACGAQDDAVQTGVMQGRTTETATTDDSLSLTTSEKNNLLQYKGGEVIRTAIKTQAIFWGSEWTDKKYAGDKVTGLTSLLGGIGNSKWLGIVNEYGATSSTSNQAAQFDPSVFPTGDLSVGSAAAEVCKLNKNAPDASTAYFIYGTKKAKANICATHGWAQCANGKKFLLAWFPDIDDAKCFTPDTVNKTRSQALKNLANATAHELAELVTDPRRTGWFAPNRDEIADRCAWTFPASNVTLSNGSSFRLINLWSNSAYEKSTGMMNASRQNGCIASK